MNKEINEATGRRDGRGLKQIGLFALSALFVTLAGCASYAGRDLKPGASTLPEIVASMGSPAMRWKDPDGREQLAYPRGPAGTQTFMVFVAAGGRLERIEPVLNVEHFARIEAGKSDKESVLRLLGPSNPTQTAYFKARNELVWEWRFCDSWNQVAWFDVLFDGTTGVVRTTAQRPELVGHGGHPVSCGH